MFDLQTAAVIYCTVLAVGFTAVWLYYDRRDHSHFERERRRTVFHCIRCDRLYTAPGGTELCRCPDCQFENTRLRY